MTTLGPSSHLSWLELRCHDAKHTAYPQKWRSNRAVALGICFEQVRDLLGGVPLHILSGYRTKAYNLTLEGAASKSQHVEGRALDILHPSMPAQDVFTSILVAQQSGKLPLLGGLGNYRNFTHMDIRPKVNEHLALWAGAGVTL